MSLILGRLKNMRPCFLTKTATTAEMVTACGRNLHYGKLRPRKDGDFRYRNLFFEGTRVHILVGFTNIPASHPGCVLCGAHKVKK